MTRAYNELYLKDAMDNLGEMFDYAQKSCNTKPELIWDLFIASGYTQSGLAEQSGLNIKTLQSYEIRGKNINRAAAESLMMLARTLGCRIEDLMEYGYDVRE